MRLGVDFFTFILFGIHWVSWICKLMSSVELGKFSTILSLGTFPFLFSFFSPMTWMLDLLLQSPRSLRIFLVIFFLLFVLKNFYCSILHFTDSFFGISMLLLSLSTFKLLIIIIFSSCDISIWLFIILLFIYWDSIF